MYSFDYAYNDLMAFQMIKSGIFSIDEGKGAGDG